MTLTEYFDCHPVDNNEQFTWEGIDFTPVQTVHVMAGYMIKYSYGLLIQQQSTRTEKHEEGYDALGNGCISSYRSVSVPVDEPVIFVSTDTQFCPNQIRDFYERANIILQDTETSPYKSGVHAHYDELATLPDEIKAKMWLYHYQPNPPQNVEPAGDPATKKRRDSIEDGFRGFAARGQIIDITSIGE